VYVKIIASCKGGTFLLRHSVEKDQRSLANPRDALHHGDRAANK